MKYAIDLSKVLIPEDDGESLSSVVSGAFDAIVYTRTDGSSPGRRAGKQGMKDRSLVD